MQHIPGFEIELDSFAVGHHQFAFLWSNPPFMTDAEARMEWRFLRRYRDALAPGGVLAYTIPGRTMLKDKAILAQLVRFYRDHRLFWLPEPNPYGQILYLGVRREKKTESTQAAAELINVLTSRTNLLPEACTDALAIPSLPRPAIRLRGREIDWHLFRQEAAQHGQGSAGGATEVRRPHRRSLGPCSPRAAEDRRSTGAPGGCPSA